MGQYPEDLGLCPDLSRLPEEILDLIQHGGLGEHPNPWNAGAAVCTTMLQASYCVADVWMVMTDSANGISKPFFEEDGEWAGVHLELLISETHYADVSQKGGKHKHVATSRGPPEDNVTKNACNKRRKP